MAFRSDIIDRIISPECGDLSPELAKYFLGLGFTEAERNRCEELSYKAQEGNLSSEERQELDCYLWADTFLMVLQAKARRSLSPEANAR